VHDLGRRRAVAAIAAGPGALVPAVAVAAVAAGGAGDLILQLGSAAGA
jgi:hypothetical protein